MIPAVAALAALAAAAPAVDLAAGVPEPGLLQSSDLRYLGAFRVPGGDFGSPKDSGFHYGGTALVYNPARDSLLMVGHDWHQLVAEIRVPRAVKRGALADLATAEVLRGFFDPLQGRRARINAGGAAQTEAVKIGGLLIDGDRLVVSVYAFYDAAKEATVSHFVSALDLPRGGAVGGPYAVGSWNPGFVGGYMAQVPAQWRPSLGGPALTGNCCIPIISRTSLGPAAFVFDPAALGRATPVPATPVVGYPIDHSLDGLAWDATSPFFNGASEVKGVVLPEGTRSVLFFGRHGAGRFCYGTGAECNDPVDRYKGTHAYPYKYQVWAYDVDDLAAVKAGRRPPWGIRPYAMWNFELPFQDGANRLGGAAYDAATGRVFLSQARGDDSLPVIHVFSLREQAR